MLPPPSSPTNRLLKVPPLHLPMALRPLLLPLLLEWLPPIPPLIRLVPPLLVVWLQPALPLPRWLLPALIRLLLLPVHLPPPRLRLLQPRRWLPLALIHLLLLQPALQPQVPLPPLLQVPCLPVQERRRIQAQLIRSHLQLPNKFQSVGS